MDGVFSVLLLVGRPACGKSCIIESLRQVSPGDRRTRFHIADLDVLDDFPTVWSWLEEDRILSERLGQPRLHTEDDGSFKYDYLWDVLVERLSLEYHGRLLADPTYHDHTTTVIEFSRGSACGGYAQAFAHLADDLLQRAGIIYVRVSFEESMRRNRARFRPDRPGGTLEHAVPDDLPRRMYREDGWSELTARDPNYLTVRDNCVPHTVFQNEEALEDCGSGHLTDRLEATLSHLWDLRRQR